MSTLTQTAPRITRPSPLSQYERTLFAAAANKAEDIEITASDIWTIRNDASTTTFWIHLRDGKQLPFDKAQFSSAMELAKKEYAASRVKELELKKPVRSLKVGHRVIFDSKVWEVAELVRENLGAIQGISNFHCIRFALTLRHEDEYKILNPYSEAIFKMA